MSYTLNKTDGTILTELVDGILDVDTTDISLVGQNYRGYGEFINENFIKMLENFANTTVPLSPLRGQLWYDTNLNKLKIYNGEEFISAAGSFVSPIAPQNPVAGDTWYDSSRNQLNLYDGEEFRLVGPQYTLQQGRSGLQVRTIQDVNSNSKVVLEIRVSEVLQAVVSREQFTPRNNNSANIIPELVTTQNPTGIIYQGVNLVNSYDFKYFGTATRAENLITTGGLEFSADDVVRNDLNQTTQGSIRINNNAGLEIGIEPNASLSISNGLQVKNLVPNENMRFFVNSTTGTSETEAITVLAENQYVGIFNSTPGVTLDVAGNTRIAGNLLVEGTTTTIESTQLSVTDKNIELAVTALPTDVTADGGGITIKGTTDKTINWVDATDSWTLSENVDIATGKEFRIGGTTILDSTTLYNVVSINETLTSLSVDNISLDGSTITAATSLTIQSSGANIDVTTSKIVNLATPTVPTDASNKQYVDLTVDLAPVIFSLDITGFAPIDINNNIIDHLTQVSPPSALLEGKQAKIITTRLTTQTIDNIDVRTSTQVSYAQAVVDPRADTDPDAGDLSTVTLSELQTEEVVSDIALPTNLSVAYTPVIERVTRLFQINSLGAWVPALPTGGTAPNIYPNVPYQQ